MKATSILAGFVVVVALGVPLPRHATAAPDNTLGMAMLSAVVNVNGELVGGAGATTAIKSQTGVYQLVFRRDVSACHYIPTLFPLAAGSTMAGSAGAGSSSLFVGTMNTNGEPTDIAFQILVFCGR